VTALGFAHRGASAHAPENTLWAFRRALVMGATGIETDVWLTADGVAVLHHGDRVRLKPIPRWTASSLPRWIPTLRQLYDACGTDFDLSVDLKDGRSAELVIGIAQDAGHDLRRLWLCGGVEGPLSWRSADPTVRLVAGTDPRRVQDWAGHLARLKEGGIDAVNVRRGGWTRTLVEEVHDAGLLAFGWDAQSRRRLRALLDLGCDAVYSDYVDRMVDVLSSDRRPR
jgi:glycerophosphoryl diester phosphodiesterase